ncbi:amidohydrolase family protein [Paractinoplanes atraurantiacus]|uniref:Amidohydrolase family protein n=1 Tax=Paractinoplanes atraurantiacus TaxID=1036182 RepID=A0A285IGK6_9ACTN|nr:amidohydrolase family protein [Actinoplanes atraurantiacus]SNY47140.1 Amidohydrolase family protein [Actinoplanes atraurantiacus]
MQRRTILTGTALGVAAMAIPRAAEAQRRAVLAIRNVTVIDARGGARRGHTVLIRGDRILDVAPAERVPVPTGATVVDGRGKFLIPGLADMHTHATGIDDTDPELYVVNGVTTTRQMSGGEQARVWRQQIADGERRGPRWVIGSRIVDGSPSLWDGLDPDGGVHLAVAGPEQARAAVRQEHAAGAAFIKTYSRLSRESFLAVADECRTLGLPFLGHVPDVVSLSEASDRGLRTVEHLFTVFYDTSSDEERLRRAVAAVPIGPGDYNGWFNRMHPLEYAAARSYDRRKAGRVFHGLAANGTFVTPTLVLHETNDMPEAIDRHDPRFRYVSADMVGYWDWSLEGLYLPGRTPQRVAESKDLFRRRLRLTADMAAAGVPLMAGTDLGTTYLMPGFSLHDELELLVRAGLKPIQALAAATLNPARYLGRRDLGVIAAGAVADLVLLGADPLHDIRNTTRIDSVVVRGELLDPSRRRQMLAAVETEVSRPRPAAAAAYRACPC